MSKSKEIVAADSFSIMKADPKAIMQSVSENVGVGGINAGDLERIKIPSGGGRFWEVQTLDGLEAKEELEIVILSMRDARAYWPPTNDDEDENKNQPPDCFSDDGINGQGEPGGACASCQYAKFGSAHKGKGQACKALKMLFVVTPDDIIPRVISLPPTSLKPLKQHMLRLVNRGIPYWHVVTKFGLEADVNDAGDKYSRVLPSVSSRLEDSQIETIANMREALQPFFDTVRVNEEDYVTTEATVED